MEPEAEIVLLCTIAAVCFLFLLWCFEPQKRGLILAGVLSILLGTLGIFALDNSLDYLKYHLWRDSSDKQIVVIEEPGRWHLVMVSCIIPDFMVQTMESGLLVGTTTITPYGAQFKLCTKRGARENCRMIEDISPITKGILERAREIVNKRFQKPPRFEPSAHLPRGFFYPHFFQKLHLKRYRLLFATFLGEYIIYI